MSFIERPKRSARQVTGLVSVAILHVILGWALVAGTARDGLKLLKKPLEAVVVQEVIIPPPPPPPTAYMYPPGTPPNGP